MVSNIMVNKTILLFGILFLIGTIFAATNTLEVEDVFKLNNEVSYAKGCFNNGSLCSAATQCNYTIFNPDKSILKNNIPATNNGSNFNITFYPQQIGIYQADMFCCDGPDCGSDTMYFQTTGSGQNDNVMVYIIILIVLGSLIGLGFYLTDGSFVILGGFGLTIFSLFILLNGISSIQSKELTWGIGLIMLFSGTYLGIRSSWEMYDSLD
jgi:hypothetical protein